MHHLYPSLKGDQFCPLGFHPQTRYPTRCKRCFRDYKEHGNRRSIDDVATSSPNLYDATNARNATRSWTSSQNLSSLNGNESGGSSKNDIELKKRPQSWASTPNIDEAERSARNTIQRMGVTGATNHDENDIDVTVKIPVPPRRHTTMLDFKELQSSLVKSAANSTSLPSNAMSSSLKDIPEDLIMLASDSLAERSRKLQLLKKQRSQNSRESSREPSVPRKSDEADEVEVRAQPERSQKTAKGNGNFVEPKRVSSLSSRKLSPRPTNLVPTTSANLSKLLASSQGSQAPTTKLNRDESSASTTMSPMSPMSPMSVPMGRKKESSREPTTNDSKYSKKKGSTPDNLQAPASPDGDFKEEIRSLRHDLEVMRTRAERAEREKSDIMLRRLASMDTTSNRTAASEALLLQQKVNELKDKLDKMNEEKRKLNTRMKDLENNPRGLDYEMKRKLQAAEQLCEELMEENQAVKREMRNMEAEMDEMHDSFRDNQAEVNTSLQKQLETTGKNCRILTFKLKKCERKIDAMEMEKRSWHNENMAAKVKELEEELRFSTDLARKLQAEADEMRSPLQRRTPTLGVIGKSTSADGKITRESLTRGGSQEDPQQLMRDLQDSVERESDLREQLKFAEEEAENLRKKVARFEDENDSLMMQLKKMASRSKNQRLSPATRRLVPEMHTERDEGISDEDDPAELRILLELNEQEASILRLKVEDMEKENSEYKKQVKELLQKMRNDGGANKKSSLLSFGASSSAADKKVRTLNEELSQLRKTLAEKDGTIERLQFEVSVKGGAKTNAVPLEVGADTKRKLQLLEQETTALKTKISTLENENDRLQNDNKKMQTQALRKIASTPKNDDVNYVKLKESLITIERERDELAAKLKMLLHDGEGGNLAARTPKRITDLTPKNQLKKWVEELEEEVGELRVMVASRQGDKVRALEREKLAVEEELQRTKDSLATVEGDIQKLKATSVSTTRSSELELKLKRMEEENKKLNMRSKDFDEKMKKQNAQMMQCESARSSLELQCKTDKEKIDCLAKDCERERKDREKSELQKLQLEEDLNAVRTTFEKRKSGLEKELKEWKSKVNTMKKDSKQMQDMEKQVVDLQALLDEERASYGDLKSLWEKLSEETILMRAQLTTEKQNLQSQLVVAEQRLRDVGDVQSEKSELSRKLHSAQSRLRELEVKHTKENMDYEKALLKDKLKDKEQEYDRLRRENDMNIDLVFQLRKDNDELSRKINDFSRIEQAQSSLNGHSASLEAEIKALKMKLDNSEIQLKAEVASTRLRYDRQMKNLSTELTSMQRQCERFKKDRDTFKQMLESAQKKIADLKANNTGRQSRTSMQGSDDDDKSKIAYLEQQVGGLEDQLVEARLEVSKFKTELVSERSAKEVKISEMQSKLNEFEEERVIGSGRTKIAGMKTKLELSWQKEREEQQRLVQETSTLARDLRQTLFEVERERDKERLESKRRNEQLKRSTEEEMEEGRKKIAELQYDLLELRDVHAKLRTSNEKLRRERERYEKELIKRRVEQDGGERRVAALLQTVDEFLQLAPDLKTAIEQSLSKRLPASTRNALKPEQANSVRRSRSPSPSANPAQISSVLVRLGEVSDDLRKFQRTNEDESERLRLRRASLRRAASQENDPHGSNSSVASNSATLRVGSKLSRSSVVNGNGIRKSLSLDQSLKRDQNIWRQDEEECMSSVQSIGSANELGGLGRDSSCDSRLSGGSTQSDIPHGPRRKKKSIMGKLRSFAKSSWNSESEVSIQGSDSDVSVASDLRTSKKDLRGRLSGMFKRAGSTPRSSSTEVGGSGASRQQRPVAVVVVGDPGGPEPREPPPANTLTPKPIRAITKPPTPTPTTPITRRRLAK